jgi:hypothetical protein
LITSHHSKCSASSAGKRTRPSPVALAERENNLRSIGVQPPDCHARDKFSKLIDVLGMPQRQRAAGAYRHLAAFQQAAARK